MLLLYQWFDIKSFDALKPTSGCRFVVFNKLTKRVINFGMVPCQRGNFLFKFSTIFCYFYGSILFLH